MLHFHPPVVDTIIGLKLFLMEIIVLVLLVSLEQLHLAMPQVIQEVLLYRLLLQKVILKLLLLVDFPLIIIV